MGGTAILFILTVASVVSIFLYVAKSILDQLLGVLDSFRRVRDAWRSLMEEQDENNEGQDKATEDDEGQDEAVLAGDEEQPPTAA